MNWCLTRSPTRRGAVSSAACAGGRMPWESSPSTFQVSQPAVSQHLAVLRRARLVRSRATGTSRLYQPNLAGVAALRKYLDRMWDDVLEAYADSFNDQPDD